MDASRPGEARVSNVWCWSRPVTFHMTFHMTHVTEQTHLFRVARGDDDDVFYLFLQKQKLGAKLHIYL